MSAHMKMHHIKKKYGNIEIIWEKEVYVFNNVPKSKISHIVEELEPYIGESTPWRDCEEFKKMSIGLKGKEAYKESALMVKSSRARNNMTQKKLSQLLGVLQTNLSQIENAKRPIGKSLALKLGKVFNINYKLFLSDLPS